MPLGAEAFMLWGEWYQLGEERRAGYAERERERVAEEQRCTKTSPLTVPISGTVT